MRCKVGDLAVVVYLPQEYERNIGALVTVESLQRPGLWNVVTLSSAWCRRANRGMPPGERTTCRDDFLRPLRDGPGQDEMLRIADLPINSKPLERV